ncbi:hypothetical protein DPMN_022693 [Dreissena polymorpha]|uniref:Uncharacterized protein n=2 Tax=Dreissena polymorpha TaxID=45954 RepID=A0A9D4NP10_DREPO|nr:hypothetical protein DPMN_022693 [Dreissena polymorpha]
MCEGCSCWYGTPLTPKSFGCRSDFIIIAEVLSDMRSLVPTDIFNMYYRIRRPSPRDIIKFTRSMAGINLRRVYTAENSALCGIRLDRGWHILSGYIEGNRLMMNLCMSWREPFPMSMEAETLLSRFAGNSVKCLPEDFPWG